MHYVATVQDEHFPRRTPTVSVGAGTRFNQSATVSKSWFEYGNGAYATGKGGKQHHRSIPSPTAVVREPDYTLDRFLADGRGKIRPRRPVLTSLR